MEKQLLTMNELFVKMFYQMYPKDVVGCWYAELDDVAGEQWGVVEHLKTDNSGENSVLCYEASFTETEAKLLALLYNMGIAEDWDDAQPYIEGLENN